MDEQQLKQLIQDMINADRRRALYTTKNVSYHTHNNIDSPMIIRATNGTVSSFVNQFSKGTGITFTYPTNSNVKISNVGVTQLNAGTNITLSGTTGTITIALLGLSGSKVYYVADSSGGATTRKLTFTNGILTAET